MFCSQCDTQLPNGMSSYSSCDRLIALKPSIHASSDGTIFSFFVVARKDDEKKMNFDAEDPYNALDIVLCKDVNNSRPVVLKGQDRFLHTLVLSPIGYETRRALLPLIYQDLRKIAEGNKMGITVIGHDENFINNITLMCLALDIPYTLLDPKTPASARFNPLVGPSDVAAETMWSVLRTTFGKQEAFFSRVQEAITKNVVLLLREIKGEELDIVDMMQALYDPEILSNYVDQMEHKKGEENDLVRYFRHELLGTLKDKYHQFTAVLKHQLEDLIGYPMLTNIMTGAGGIDLDRHLNERSVLLVNTAIGPLEKMGDTFGQFVLMHFQNAVLRRLSSELIPTPHFLYVDELQRYVNPDLERMLVIGRRFRYGAFLALQAMEQLELAGKMNLNDIVIDAIHCGTPLPLQPAAV